MAHDRNHPKGQKFCFRGPQMSDVIDQPKEGDVFRWYYLDPKADGRNWGSYHCCSCIGIFHNGRLRDTFWQIGMSFSDGRSFGVEDFAKLKLEYLGNLADFDKAQTHHADYYAPDDCMNLNHSNSSRDNFYVRKGAQRSAARMLEVARYKLERSESDERSAARRSADLRKAIAEIEAGSTDVHLF
jgi:hypothetical protein